MKRLLKQAGSVGIVLAVALFSGCNGDGKKSVYKVQGKVLDAKKKPAVGVLVTFQPVKPDAKDAARPTATTDEQGNYVLTTYTQGDGAPEGDYIITAVWPPPRRSPLDPAGGDQLNGRLAKSETSPHKFTVEKKRDTQQVPDLILP